MPMYLYECDSCNRSWRTMHSMDEPLKVCNFCESEEIRKLPMQTQKPVKTKRTRRPRKKAGSEVKKAIEENRKILKKSKKDAKNTKWVPKNDS